VNDRHDRVKLPKLGLVSRSVDGTPKHLTISQGEYLLVSIQAEEEVAAPVHPANGAAIGVDVGVAKFAVLNRSTR